uniref:Uncharacterized protein n=1 Tax=Rangifer tarandus platyrhynchus TaxID=3082113 RepID=A0ACB0E8A7_RANTA|nr:unnamed protein product [Rangifer tarandus platyrhynchus]
MPPESAPVPPPTAFKKRLAEEQRAGGLDDWPILARLLARKRPITAIFLLSGLCHVADTGGLRLWRLHG